MPRLIKSEEDPYQTLVVTIISQNTADTNTERAYKNLSERFQITPKVLANAEISQIETCIRVAGLYQTKAKTIKTVSQTLLEKFDGNLKSILVLPTQEARKTLMDMSGVGPKTADVVLLFSAGKPTIPVDTHVNRVSKRLGLAPANSGYEEVRLNLQRFFEPKDYRLAHLLFIAHGRKTCKAQKPLCTTCPLNVYCPSARRVN
ncbi:MAG: endonuclease III [Nitrososphaerota archaeon]|uniref:endonuclease III domain-containing protein n=1 Tax=Candidatus Bathycorpusculum sp. TaxID=2994959 RepID=UPI0028320C14|nr:endonuclease III [Candidatus Termitimicrobium sp.]MCL2431427.1 endonuclease III [Candidatus Termitimicrobium sp.]MDR0492733.1 endonuclease III [Nitrososphaerota archaeon]